MSGADRNFEKSVDSRRPEVYDLGHRTAKALWTVLSTAPFLSAFRQAEAVAPVPGIARAGNDAQIRAAFFQGA